MRRRALCATVATALWLAGCSDARLYGVDTPVTEADRLTLKGRVCAADPLAARLPVRLVLVVDQAAGPMFADYDPAAERIQFLRTFVQSALDSPNTQLAIVGFAGRSRTLAPSEGNFTRNPGEVLSAVDQLSIAQPCSGGDDCRDYLEGLRTARALIEGDMAETPAGDRVLTQYIVVLATAGPQQPLANNTDCCQPTDAACRNAVPSPDPACQSTLEREEIDALVETVQNRGALGLRLHTLHFAADTPEIDEQVSATMRTMAFSGSGTFTRAATPTALSLASFDVLGERSGLRVKTLYVANIHAKPTPSGPVVDSDADGLGDEEEERLGTSATDRDTDGDGIGDLIESLVDFDPLTTDEPTACRRVDPSRDSDLDGLGDCDEVLLGTEPTLVDTDGDGMPDSLEVIGFTDYLHDDAETDTDNDGTSNADEIRQRTDPRSTDARSHLSFGYRYELEDEGVRRELFALPLTQLTGVEVVGATQGSTPGLGTLRYRASDRALRWQDGMDSKAGPWVEVTDGDELELPSSSYAPVQGEDGRLLRVRVDEAQMPIDDTVEQLRLIYREQHCLTYTVRNVRLMDTEDLDGAGRGENRIALFFSETAEGRLEHPGPYRIAEVPITYRPPDFRDPASPVLHVLDEEFTRPR